MPLFDIGKHWHFVISLLLLKIFTSNSEYIFTIERAIHTIKGDKSKCIFFFSELCPVFDLDFIPYQAPHSRELAQPRVALVPLCFHKASSAGVTKSQCWVVNPLPHDKILGLPKLKAFADDKLNVTQDIKVFFHRMENIVGKEENAGYQHFLLFPQCFQKPFSSSVSKVVIVW